jgi:hypothetical protein
VNEKKKKINFIRDGMIFMTVQMLVESVVSCPQSKDGSLVRSCQLVVTVLLLKSLEQEPSGIERRDMAITNNTPGEALWTHGCPTEDHQIRSGN